ncbi:MULTISPECIES: hypothetical protein [Wolbachia]|uniref:hypothetical protein n=1 Tax=Wolbachia TaxID=953 RepID=UPI000349D12F|nr:hypothetical protein [Wolbachia pipientis]
MKEIRIYEKSSNQPIAAGVVGALLLVSCVAFYVLFRSGSMWCMDFALYNATKPNTKLE